MTPLRTNNLKLLSILTVLSTFTVPPIGSFAVTSLAQGTENQIVVGPNVQVSNPDSNSLHYEVMLAAHPQKAETLIGGSMIWSEGTGYTSVAYVSNDGGKHWASALTVGKPGEDLDYTDPAGTFRLDGSLYFLSNARTPEPNVRAYAKLYHSTDRGATWRVVNEFP